LYKPLFKYYRKQKRNCEDGGPYLNHCHWRPP